MKRLLLAVGVLTLTLFCGNAHAAFVFSNFGPGDTFATNIGYTVSPSATPGMKFTATGGGTLSQINLALSTFRGGSTAVTVEFYADNTNTIGTLLASGSTTTNGALGMTHPPSVAIMSAAAIV